MFRSLISFCPDDFEHLKIKRPETIMLLFYFSNNTSNNLENIEYFSIWNTAANTVVGVNYGECNLSLNNSDKILQDFLNLNDFPDTIYNKIHNKLPFIVVYKKGKPIGFYDKDIDIKVIIKYSLELSR
jgi:hypothetical protein